MGKVGRPDLDNNETREVQTFWRQERIADQASLQQRAPHFDAFVEYVVRLASVRKLGSPALSEADLLQIDLHVRQALAFHNVLDRQGVLQLDKLESLVDTEPLFNPYKQALKEAIKQKKIAHN